MTTAMSVDTRLARAEARDPGQVAPQLPDLVGLQSNIAAAKLKKAGLRIGLMHRVRDDRHPPFTIVRQTPEPGTKVGRGSAVNIVIARSDR